MHSNGVVVSSDEPEFTVEQSTARSDKDTIKGISFPVDSEKITIEI